MTIDNSHSAGLTKDDRAPSPPRYRSAVNRTPKNPPLVLYGTREELSGPIFGHNSLTPDDSDLTQQHDGQPQGERIIVAGRLLDDQGRPVTKSLIEIWQTNAAGRYIHDADQHDAPLDPNFTGAGRAVTDEDGWYRFITVKPGAYPWGNHPNAWRPAHIHFSLFGPSFLSRLVTQMYFSEDPLLPFDPILQAVPDSSARNLLVAKLDFDLTQAGWALGYRFDITLFGSRRTPTGN